ncbi:MAG: hypothetical protein WEE67_00280 [Chloroflexota bacterium]
MAFLTPKLVIPLLLYAGYVVVVVALAGRVALWTPDLLKDTVLWFLVSGVVMFFNFDEASKDGYVRRRLRLTAAAGLVFAVYLNLVSFPLPVELGIQVLAVVLVLAAAAGRLSADTKRWAEVAEMLLGVLVLAIGAGTAFSVVRDVSALDPAGVARSVLLPVWLGAASMMFVYGLALFANYELAFMRIARLADTATARRRAKLALVLGLHVRNKDVHALAGSWLQDVATSDSIREALRILAEYRLWRREKADAERRERDHLVMFAGVPGTDGAGRQLDRREFVETVDALRWLGTCQMGWHRQRGGRYRNDLLKIFQPGFTKGLPDDHGIEMRVRKGGQSWFAWRRTPSGWHFAIGSIGHPPDQWFYDGPDPPDRFPSAGSFWKREPGPNWLRPGDQDEP